MKKRLFMFVRILIGQFEYKVWWYWALIVNFIFLCIVISSLHPLLHFHGIQQFVASNQRQTSFSIACHVRIWTPEFLWIHIDDSQVQSRLPLPTALPLGEHEPVKCDKFTSLRWLDTVFKNSIVHHFDTFKQRIFMIYSRDIGVFIYFDVSTFKSY